MQPHQFGYQYFLTTEVHGLLESPGCAARLKWATHHRVDHNVIPVKDRFESILLHLARVYIPRRLEGVFNTRPTASDLQPLTFVVSIVVGIH